MFSNAHILTQHYLKNEDWHDKKLPYEEAMKYHQSLMDSGNIIAVIQDGELLGYVEFLRINFEQFGKMVCHAPFFILDENITDGNICVVHNVWIRKDCRRGPVFFYLRDKFYEINHTCEYYAGFALRKKTQPIKVFKKENLKSMLFTTGER